MLPTIAGVSHVSCEPDMLHILDMSHRPRSAHAQLPPGTALTIQTLQLEPGTSLATKLGPGTSLATKLGPATSLASLPALDKVKLEPGLLQTLPPEATPLKVEVQETYLDSGEGDNEISRNTIFREGACLSIIIGREA